MMQKKEEKLGKWLTDIPVGGYKVLPHGMNLNSIKVVASNLNKKWIGTWKVSTHIERLR